MGVELQAAGNNWMAGVDGEKYLYELSIPGTHDSGALHEAWYEIGVQCQSLTIPEQLNAGVRYLDIRCRHLNNAFVIHHDAYYQHQNFNDVLESVTSFLRANPSETVVMLVKPEYTSEGNTRTFAETFKAYQAEWETRYPKLWYVGTTIPKLVDVRGRIVLIRRFNEAPFSPADLGINADRGWPGDSTGTIEGPPRIRVQDEYSIYIRLNKWGYITSLFDEMPANPGTLYLNYVSCGWYPPAIIGYSVKEPAIYYNNLLDGFFDGWITPATSGRYGVVIVDFVNDRLAYLIYRTNFGQAKTERLSLSQTSISENVPLGEVLGTLVDPLNPNIAGSYRFVSGPSSEDNSRFRIEGNKIRTAAPLNHEAKSVYSVRVRQNGVARERAFTLNITDVDEPPTRVSLVNKQTGTVVAGAVVGTLSASDPDLGETFTFALAPGRGDTDNQRFTIVGNEIRAAVPLRLRQSDSYSIRVRAVDSGGLAVESGLVVRGNPPPGSSRRPLPPSAQ
ncbi:MAG: phosphatidylinositol-specific phospholipase C domain-containing protein [Bacteroidetes bacterium]|nr:phosphatidylinositol-specific phospholipase C domain-containing protein [Bacteroidota bacterium]